VVIGGITGHPTGAFALDVTGDATISGEIAASTITPSNGATGTFTTMDLKTVTVYKWNYNFNSIGKIMAIQKSKILKSGATGITGKLHVRATIKWSSCIYEISLFFDKAQADNNGVGLGCSKIYKHNSN